MLKSIWAFLLEGEQSFSEAAELRDPDPDAYLQLYSARAEAGYWEKAEDALLAALKRGGDATRIRTATELITVYLQLAEARDDPSYLQQALYMLKTVQSDGRFRWVTRRRSRA